MITKDLINDIREEIASKIPTGDDDVFQFVSAFPKSTIEGFPAVVVMVSESEVFYASTGSQDSRRVNLVFSLNIYYPTNAESGQEQAEEAMGEAVSELLRIFCVKRPLTKCDLAKVGITPWGETTIGDGVYRTAQLLLNCSVFVDTV